MSRDDEFFGMLQMALDNQSKLSERLEENHRDLVERMHKLELTVDSHQRAFSTFKWLASSGGIAGILAFFRDYVGKP
jgi:septation ring formation regulator EzrA